MPRESHRLRQIMETTICYPIVIFVHRRFVSTPGFAVLANALHQVIEQGQGVQEPLLEVRRTVEAIVAGSMLSPAFSMLPFPSTGSIDIERPACRGRREDGVAARWPGDGIIGERR